MPPPSQPILHRHLPTNIKIVLGILALALLFGLGYWVWFQNNLPVDTGGDTTVKPKTVQTTPKTVVPAVPADPTANWLTYKNTNFSFSFKYPPSYKVTDDLQTTGQGVGNQTLTLTDAADVGQPMLIINLDPDGFDGAPTNLLYSFAVNNDGTLSIVNKTKQTLDPGAMGVDPNVQIAGTNLGGTMIRAHTYIIRFSYKTGHDTLLTTFDNILGSFKAN